MNDEESVSIDQIKQIFAKATGEKMIEVTTDEYEMLLSEAKSKKLNIVKGDESFNLILPDLTIKIVCENEENEEDWE